MLNKQLGKAWFLQPRLQIPIVSYQPIENYGIIGDLHTIALANLNGSIDFMCLPNFDSPSIFARLLDDKKGGYYCIHPVFAEPKTKQLYMPDTNVLLTRFLSPDGVGEITDFMPVGHTEEKKLIRRVTTIRGEATYKLYCQPRFNYGRDKHTIEQISPKEVIFHSDGLNIRLKAGVPLEIKDGDIYAEFTLKATESADFVLEHANNKSSAVDDIAEMVTQTMYRAVNFWKEWVARSTYKGRWRDVVNRSCLVLKLLSSSRYGSIIAAPSR